HFVVAAAKDGPVSVAGAAEFGFLPADGERAAGAIDADVVRQLLIQAPGEVNAAHHAGGASHKHADGVFHRNVLHAAAFHDLNLDQRSQEVSQNIDRVRAIIDQHAAAADR